MSIYRWFGSDPDTYLVIEEYADTAAALAHNENSADMLAQVTTIAELMSAELYGTLGPELLAWVAARPQVVAYPDLDLNRPDDASTQARQSPGSQRLSKLPYQHPGPGGPARRLGPPAGRSPT